MKNGVNSKTNKYKDGRDKIKCISRHVELANTKLFYWLFKKIHTATIFGFYPYTVSKIHS